jgi:AcrR family transcriptional regulator
VSRALAPTGELTRRPRKDVLRNREHLLRVADQLVAEQGLRISLNELAHRAGVGVGTVYRHFPDPQKVLDALFDQRVEMVSELFRAAELVDDPLEALRQLLMSVGEAQAADRAVFEVIAQAMTPDQHQRLRGRLRPLATRVIERAQATGQLRADFATSDIPMIIHMLRAVSEYTLDIRPDLWRRYLEAILDGCLNDTDPHHQQRPPLATPPLTRIQMDNIVAAHAFNAGSPRATPRR